MTTRWKIPYIGEAKDREQILAHIAATERLSKLFDRYLDKAMAGVAAADLNNELAALLEAAVEDYQKYYDQADEGDCVEPSHWGSFVKAQSVTPKG